MQVSMAKNANKVRSLFYLLKEIINLFTSFFLFLVSFFSIFFREFLDFLGTLFYDIPLVFPDFLGTLLFDNSF